MLTIQNQYESEGSLRLRGFSSGIEEGETLIHRKTFLDGTQQSSCSRGHAPDRCARSAVRRDEPRRRKAGLGLRRVDVLCPSEINAYAWVRLPPTVGPPDRSLSTRGSTLFIISEL